jgi:hypothetical protein
MRIADAALVCPVVLISRWLYERPIAAQSPGTREPVSTHPGRCLAESLATSDVDGALAQATKHRLKPAPIATLLNITITSNPS